MSLVVVMKIKLNGEKRYACHECSKLDILANRVSFRVELTFDFPVVFIVMLF